MKTKSVLASLIAVAMLQSMAWAQDAAPVEARVLAAEPAAPMAVEPTVTVLPPHLLPAVATPYAGVAACATPCDTSCCHVKRCRRPVRCRGRCR